MRTLQEFFERERKLYSLVKSASSLNGLVDSAMKINEMSVSSIYKQEIEKRNQSLQSIIESSRVHTSTLQNIANMRNDYDALQKLTDSIAPIATVYASRLQDLKAIAEISGVSSLINSSALSEAKKLQSKIIQFDPYRYSLPITTLERALEANESDAFEQAEQEVKNIESTERIRTLELDIPVVEKNPSEGKPIDVLIVMGLISELRIFCEIFHVDSRWYSECYAHEYHFGSIKSNKRSYSVALVVGEDMGNFYASQATNAAVVDLKPKLVISAGIGYTLNPNKLQLCDLHITNKVVYWGMTSKECEGFGRKLRNIPVNVRSNHIFREVKSYVEGISSGVTPYSKWVKESKFSAPTVNNVESVLKEIDDAISCGIPSKIFNEHPKTIVGQTMVSGDAVIASLDEIKKRSGVTVGNETYISGEMEAAGIAMALANNLTPMEFIAIRGICDFGLGKEALESSSGEFRKIAAFRAATFICGFLQSDPSLPKDTYQKVGYLGEPLADDCKLQ